jgi:hypothetical protein
MAQTMMAMMTRAVVVYSGPEKSPEQINLESETLVRARNQTHFIKSKQAV